MVKVCHLTSVHPPFDIRIFHKECVSLANNGFDVTLIAPIAAETTKMGVKVVPIHLPGNRVKRMFVVSFRMYKLAMQQKAKIYHFHDPELMLCGVLLRLSGKKVIHDIHENNRLTIKDKEYLSKTMRKILSGLYVGVEKFFNMFYHQWVLALSEETFAKYYSPKKSSVILNFPLPIKDMESNTIKTSNEIRLIYVGVVHETRGIVEMIELAGEIKRLGHSVKLDLVGSIRPESLEQEICNLKSTNNLMDEVVLHGFVEADKVADFIARSHFGLCILYPFVRYQEALPTKFFEYMQQGLPVITNDYPLYKKYIEDTKTGICLDFSDLRKAVDKIVKIAKNDVQIKEMGKNGKALTQYDYTWASQEKKLVELYNKLLN